MATQNCARVLRLALLALLAGSAAAQTRTGRGERPAEAPPAEEPRRESGLLRVESYYPTGERDTSVLLLERLYPAEVRAGTDFDYQIRLTNLTRRDLNELTVTEQFPPALTVTGIAPQTEQYGGGRGTWRLGRLAGGRTEVIHVRGRTERVEDLVGCATVTFTTALCATTKVVQPRLALTKSAPREVLLCDPIPLRFVVSNPGSGVTRRVRVIDRLPQGLTTTDGRSAFMFEAGDLAAGQSREFTVNVQASAPGGYHNVATAQDDSGLGAEAAADITVRQPVLALVKRGPQFRYLGRPGEFELTVQNTGDAPARDAVLVDTLPAGAELISADGGQVAEGRVTWPLGTLAPGATRTVRLTLRATQVGTLRNTATVEAYCARASATTPFEVRGIPAILLEVIDAADPIEVGGNETYVIAVTNQGSAADTNIIVECTLPPEQRYVSSSGPTPGTADGQVIRFAPLRLLAPKDKAVYQVVVTGLSEGDVRFRVSMRSDQTTSPVEETESTHIYR